MLPVAKVLVSIIVKKFYERNGALFFFIFYLMFGIVEPNQIFGYHQSLIYGTLSSTVFLLVVMGVWFLYAIKYLQFILVEFDQPQNKFLLELSKLSPSKLFWSILLTVTLVYEPVLIYSVFIVFFGFASHHYWPTIAVIVFHSCILISTSFLLARRLNLPHEKITFSFFPTVRWPWPKPVPIFYISQLVNQLPTVLFFTKAFSVFAIYGFMQIPLDHYEPRVALLGLLIGLASHSVIIFELRKFEETYLRFLRGMPISLPERFLKMALVYSVLLLPEIGMLALRGVHILDLTGAVIFATGYLTLIHCKLFQSEFNMDKHTTWTLGLFLISFILVLFKIYLIETVLMWGLAYFWLKRDYYGYEVSG